MTRQPKVPQHEITQDERGQDQPATGKRAKDTELTGTPTPALRRPAGPSPVPVRTEEEDVAGKRDG